MKKKVKDLSEVECRELCWKNDWCGNCPLFATHKCTEYDPKSYEKEVYVNEEEY